MRVLKFSQLFDILITTLFFLPLSFWENAVPSALAEIRKFRSRNDRGRKGKCEEKGYLFARPQKILSSPPQSRVNSRSGGLFSFFHFRQSNVCVSDILNQVTRKKVQDAVFNSFVTPRLGRSPLCIPAKGIPKFKMHASQKGKHCLQKKAFVNP